MTHGHSGQVDVAAGDAWNLGTFAADAGDFQELRSELAPGARVDLYACNVAAGVAGQAFVNQLSAATGAVISASDDVVGTAPGGDFNWEYVTKSVPRPADLLSVERLSKLDAFALDDAYEYNDSFFYATPLGSFSSGGRNTWSNLSILHDNPFTSYDGYTDYDYYDFALNQTGKAGDFVQIAFNNQNGYYSSDAQLFLYLYNSSFVQIGSAQAVGDSEAVSLQGLAAGTYYILVDGLDIYTTNNNYSLEISTQPLGYSPTQILDAYGFDQNGVNQITFANGTVPGDGKGQTIAILDAGYDPGFLDTTDPNYNNSDLAIFDRTFGLPDPQTFKQINNLGLSEDPTTIGETSLDVEWAHAIAPEANILLFDFGSGGSGLTGLMDEVQYVTTNYPGVSVVSISYGEGEYALDQQEWYETGFDSYFQKAGMTFVVASGDTGAYGDDPNGDPYGFTPAWPAASPDVLAVGGTNLSINADNTYGSEIGWGHGPDNPLYPTLGSGPQGGSGGGVSAYEPEPNWQQQVLPQGIDFIDGRAVPDVSWNADYATALPVYYSNVCTHGSDSVGWTAWGGTSIAAPQWAGLLAIVNQGRAQAIQPALTGYTETLPALYNLANNSTTYARDFHDITSGNNGYPAGTGYDLVTGLGTPIANNLVPDLVNYESQLVVTSEPQSSVTAGSPLINFTVKVEDGFNDVVTSYNGLVKVALANNPGGSTFNPITMTAHNGVATFSGLALNKVSTGYTFTATADSLTPTTTTTITVTPAAVSQLVITAQPPQPPGSVAVGVPFGLTIAAEDQYNNVNPTYATSVTIALLNNPGQSTLSGTLTVNPVNGVATFSGLTLNNIGNGYTIQATSGSLTVTTNPFNVTARPTFVWANPAGGDWNTPSNWTGGVVPGMNDNAVIPDSFGSITVTYSSGTSEIHSLTDAETLQISGGSFQIDVASTANNITQTGGTLTGAGDLTVSGTYAWSGGTQSGTGSTILAPGAQMNISGSVTAGRAIDDTAAGAAINWTGGTVAGTLNNPGQLTINTTTAYAHLAGTLNNTGTIIWTGGTYLVLYFDGGTLNNQSGGTVNSQVDNTFYLNSGSPQIMNAGTFEKTGGTGTTSITVPFSNSGAVQVQTGTISFNTTVSVSAGASFSGGGTLLISGGTLSINGAASAASLTQVGGTLNGAGNLTVSGTYAWSGGTQSGTGSTILAAGAQMNISGSVTAGRAIDDTAAGAAINWTGGTIAGTLNNPGQLTINTTTAYAHLAGTLNNTGTIIWTGGTYLVLYFDGGTLNNQSGGTVNSQVDNTFYLNSGSPQIMNAGTFEKTGGTGTTSITVPFSNSGAVQVQTGTISFSTTVTVSAGASFSGGGTLLISGGTLSINGAASAASLTQVGGTLNGAGNLTVSGTYAWSGGTQSGTGSTILAAGAQMNISGSVTAGRAIDDTAAGAAINWSGGTIAGTLNNPGQLTINTTAYAHLAGTLNNTGTIIWTGGTYLVLYFDGGTLNNQSGGTVNSQVDNTFYLNSGSPQIMNAGTFEKTGGTGTTSITVPFNNSGTVQVQTGTISLADGGTQSGNFHTNSSTSLLFAGGTHTLGAGTSFTGAGTAGVTAGTVSVDAAVAATNFSQSGGTLQGSSNLTVSGTYAWSGGTQSGTGSTILAPGAQMNISGSVTAGRAIDDTAAGAAINWTGGTVAGTLNNPGQLTINTTAYAHLAGTLNNTGTIIWTGGTYLVLYFDGGTLNNQSGGTVNSQVDNTFYLNSGSPQIMNAGTFEKTGGTGTTSITVPFSNSGAVQVQTGTISFSTTVTVSAGASFSGGGTLLISGGTLSINGAASAASLTQVGGTLNGAGNLTVSGTYAWSGGTQSGTGSTILAAGAR